MSNATCPFGKNAQKTRREVYDTVKSILPQALADARVAFKGFELNAEEQEQLVQLATAIAEKESTRKLCAKNPNSTARGLMQILSGTQKAIERRLQITKAGNVYEPRYAIRLALNELIFQYRRYERNWNDAILAYNQGNAITPVAKRNGRPYVTAVMKYHQEITQELFA